MLYTPKSFCLIILSFWTIIDKCCYKKNKRIRRWTRTESQSTSPKSTCQLHTKNLRLNRCQNICWEWEPELDKCMSELERGKSITNLDVWGSVRDCQLWTCGFLKGWNVRVWQNTKKKKVWPTEKRRGGEESDQWTCKGRDGKERFGKTVLYWPGWRATLKEGNAWGFWAGSMMARRQLRVN